MTDSIEAQILRGIKSNRGCALIELRITLPKQYENTDYSSSYHFLITESLQRLITWGLIDAYDKSGNFMTVDNMNLFNSNECTFFLSHLAAEMEETIGIDFGRVTQPVFGEPAESSRYPQLFILMPFSQELRPVFDDHLKKVAEEMGLSAGRADDFFSTGSIINDIWSAIYNAHIIIADCTGRNPNVFYEIGIAHTLGKDTILIAQNIDDVPFDLRHLRVVIYQYTPRGMTEFESKLHATLNEVQNKKH